MPRSQRILVVGAGLAGAVYARRLAEAGYEVQVIDRRQHIAGNCFDEVDANGVRVHLYGPHLFHTSNNAVVSWLSRFTEWIPYEHKVVARLPNGRMAPLPVNLDTVNKVFGKSFATAYETENFLSSISENRDPIKTAEDHLYSVIGRELTELFFRPYTAKMWSMDLAEMSPSVVRRLKVQMNRDPRYFPGDRFQAVPKNGYTEMFQQIFDHENIFVEVGRAFDRNDSKDYLHVFNSMPIDEYFDFELGELPYRSIRFHVKNVPTSQAEPHVVINYTDTSRFTRETWWHNIPGHQPRASRFVTRTIEEPCDYRDNRMERYYPVKTHDGRYDALYREYEVISKKEPRMTFIGRCGTYQYLDMHQVVNQSLSGVTKWLAARS